MIKNSMLRVQKYLDRLSTAKRYNQECIHSFLEGWDVETSLLVSDLKALCQFASSAIDATNSTQQGLEAKLATPAHEDARDAARYRWLRDNDWRNDEKMEPVIRLHLNAIWDEKIDAALAAQAKQGGAA